MQLDDEAIFHDALEIGTAEARAAYLDQVCGGDRGAPAAGSRRLLRAHDRGGGASWSRPPAVATVTATSAWSPRPSGPARSSAPTSCVEQIGEGGMGLVYMAEQQQPAAAAWWP